MQLPDRIYARVAAFSLVGVVNTIVGVGLIAIAGIAGAGPILANVVGYGVGLVVSFTLNSRITFQSRTADRYTAARFLGAFAVAFLVNLGAVWIATHVLGFRGVLPSLAGVPLFTLTFYVLCECWVFRRAQPALPEQSQAPRAHP